MLLYIKCNPRSQTESACLTVAQALVEAYKQRRPEEAVEELDLYSADIPLLDYSMLKAQSELKSGNDYEQLGEPVRLKVDQANKLCKQFVEADRYIIAAPMWSLDNPPMLKAYLDLVIQKDKTISIEEDRVKGILNDRPRKAVFVQSSGGKFSNIFLSRLNFGYQYLKNMFIFLGFDDFIHLPVEGTGDAVDTKAYAVARARREITDMVNDLR